MAKRAKTPVLKPAPSRAMELLENGLIAFHLEGGGTFYGTEDEINALLGALGFHAIAVRHNMMSKVAYIEARDTPPHLSPGSETYWSM